MLLYRFFFSWSSTLPCWLAATNTCLCRTSLLSLGYFNTSIIERHLIPAGIVVASATILWDDNITTGRATLHCEWNLVGNAIYIVAHILCSLLVVHLSEMPIVCILQNL